MTITSNIDVAALKTSGTSPQEWLDRLAVPEAGDVVVKFRGEPGVGVGERFTKKLFLGVEKRGVEGLGGLCFWQVKNLGAEGSGSGTGGSNEEDSRDESIKLWLREWDPHVSLLYSDIEIDEAKRKELEDVVLQSGITFDGYGDLSGWSGGMLWLVDTSKPISEWKPLAERKLVGKEEDVY
ncbi:hypothetical protein EJ08DRAFT_660280 [Tothia fuscella]|uniref:Uncharacterized protein n=1 Tax=Tothia fuscella TaxID=1048955 RepID=A0A9P4NSY7_9PEZI|nr:hypothetical protein EJ08DRAFT_660280 [Tothia fuscella]